MTKIVRRRPDRIGILAGLSGLLLLPGAACSAAGETGGWTAPPEVRGTWLTTTANDAIASPENTRETMRRLRDMGFNTVYVETWKNGYTQYPSAVLEGVIGVDRRPDLVPQDPSDSPETLNAEPRDLLQETLIEAHRHGLLYIGWFEYGFMAAHHETMNHLREMKPEWLSRDIDGNEVAPNGFVWMNPLHPETRRFLLDIVLEAVDRYDVDGVQFDDRIVWPYVTMGYDDYTREVYASEHDGRRPPEDHTDPDWMRWRADKVNEYAKKFVEEIREARPGLIVSLSPAPYPWCYEHHLLEWPRWADWTPGGADGRWWDEFIPQAYRRDYEAFRATWEQQLGHVPKHRHEDLLAGIRVVGAGPDTPWVDVERKIDLVRETGGGGHVLWFSRGVLDVYPREVEAFYERSRVGPAPHPRRDADWRPGPVELRADALDPEPGEPALWFVPLDAPGGNYRLIGFKDGRWEEVRTLELPPGGDDIVRTVQAPPGYERAELLVDRRPDMQRPLR